MVQLSRDQARKPTGHGGWRPGAGRPRGRTKVAHEKREPVKARFPLHVTLRAAQGVPSLRRKGALGVVREAIARAGRNDTFRVHFQLLSNHLHLIIEAASREALARGWPILDFHRPVRLKQRIPTFSVPPRPAVVAAAAIGAAAATAGLVWYANRRRATALRPAARL